MNKRGSVIALVLLVVIAVAFFALSTQVIKTNTDEANDKLTGLTAALPASVVVVENDTEPPQAPKFQILT